MFKNQWEKDILSQKTKKIVLGKKKLMLGQKNSILNKIMNKTKAIVRTDMNSPDKIVTIIGNEESVKEAEKSIYKLLNI